jgi:hypothetical protein
MSSFEQLQRPLDANANRIAGLGLPTTANDATYTDNATTPAADAGAGSPGTSKLASPADHVHPTPSAAVTYTATTQDLGVGRKSGTFDITGLAGLTAGKYVAISQSAAAVASKGNATDEPEMDMISLTGFVLNATTIRAYWNCPSFTVGVCALSYLVSA